MIIVNETELMHNQKASTTITPDVEFEAVETSAGNSVLFSISSENIFYCTYEVPGDIHGWTRTDMSSVLATGNFQGQTIHAKSFDIVQNLNAGTIDLVLVVTVNNQDYLYIANNVSDANLAGIAGAWQQFPFDDQGAPQLAGKPINDVFITRADSQLYVFADINTQNATNTLSRYVVDQSNTIMNNTVGYPQVWIPHGMAMDAQAGAISNAIGCGPDDAATGGIYTLCNIANIPQLQYTPLFNQFDPGGPPFSTNFQLPSGTDATYKAMAVSASATKPFTDLFFVTNTIVNGNPTGALYFIPYNKQLATANALPSFTQVYTHDLLYDIQSIHVDNWNDNIVLWGQSKYTDPTSGTVSSQLFLMEGVRGQETNADAWSCPMPLLFGVENTATYINNTYSATSSIDAANGNAYGSCSVIFAHQADGSLVKLFQDPVTTAWQERFLLTEPLDATTVLYETISYTSHISITDDNNMVQPLIPVSIWSSSPCSVYVNNTYCNLAFDTPLQTTADEVGVINITQPVDTIGGIAFHLAVQDPNTQQWYTQTVNPFTATTANIKSQVPDGTNNYLGGDVKDETGTATPLAPNVGAADQLATSQSIYSFYTNADQANLNADGLTTEQEQAGGWPNPATSVQAVAPMAIAAGAPVKKPVRAISVSKPGRQARHMRFNPKTDKIWGCTFGKNAKHFEGIDDMKAMGLVLHDDGTMSLTMANGELGSILGAIESKAGHLFKWMKSEAEKLEQAVIKLGEDGLDCLLTIAGNIYHFVVNCVNDVVNAIHTVLNAIKTAFEDLVKWIGSIFAWSDIINTHAVIKNLFIQYGNYCIDGIDTAIDGISGFAANVVGSIDDWAGFPEDSAQSQSAGYTTDAGQHKPQSNWAHHHMKNNAGNGVVNAITNDISAFVETLMSTIETEGEIFYTNGQKLSNIDMKTIKLVDLMKEIAGIIADDFVQSIENILTKFLQLIGDLVQGMMDKLQQPITIPVLSQLYKRYVGSDLTILDLVCLVCAIPVTVIYKIVNNGEAPFEANDPLATAPDYQSIGLLCVDQSTLQAAASVGAPPPYVPPNVTDRWYKLFLSGNVMALVGGLVIAGLGYEKTKDTTNKNLAIAYTAFYLAYIGPDVVGNIPAMVAKDTRAFSVANGAFGIIGVVKSFIDIFFVSDPPEDPDAPVPPPPPGWFNNTAGLKGYEFISPWLDLMLNGAWEWPVVESWQHSQKLANDIVDLAANTFFNASGILAPFIALKCPPGPLIWAGGQTVLNALYGVGSFMESVDGQKIDPITIG
jgi:hypothetical protein